MKFLSGWTRNKSHMAAAGSPFTTGSTLLPRFLSMGQSFSISGWCHGITVSQGHPGSLPQTKRHSCFNSLSMQSAQHISSLTTLSPNCFQNIKYDPRANFQCLILVPLATDFDLKEGLSWFGLSPGSFWQNSSIMKNPNKLLQILPPN